MLSQEARLMTALMLLLGTTYLVALVVDPAPEGRLPMPGDTEEQLIFRAELIGTPKVDGGVKWIKIELENPSSARPVHVSYKYYPTFNMDLEFRDPTGRPIWRQAQAELLGVDDLPEKQLTIRPGKIYSAKTGFNLDLLHAQPHMSAPGLYQVHPTYHYGGTVLKAKPFQIEVPRK